MWPDTSLEPTRSGRRRDSNVRTPLHHEKLAITERRQCFHLRPEVDQAFGYTHAARVGNESVQKGLHG